MGDTASPLVSGCAGALPVNSLEIRSPGDGGFRDAGPLPFGGRIGTAGGFLGGDGGQLFVFFGTFGLNDPTPGAAAWSYDVYDLDAGTWTSCPVARSGQVGTCHPSCFQPNCDAGLTFGPSGHEP